MTYPNDDYANATTLTGTSGSITPFHYDGIGDPATSETGELVIGAGQTLWWKWTATGDGSASFTTSGSSSDDSSPDGLDTKLQVFTSFGVSIASNDDGADVTYNYNSRVTFDTLTGTTYWIQVDQYGGGQAGTVNLSWTSVAYTHGPWLTPPPQTDVVAVTNNRSSAHPIAETIAQGIEASGADWTATSEVSATVPQTGASVGVRARLDTPVPAFIERNRPGAPRTGLAERQDVWAIVQFPFNVDLSAQIAGLSVYSPALPAGAVAIEYEGATEYDPDTWSVAAEVRFLIEANDTRLVTFGFMEGDNPSLDPPIFTPVAATVQVRAVDYDPAASPHIPGADLAAFPLLWEQAADDSRDQLLDSGYLSIDPADFDGRILQLTYAEQVTHTDPAPSPTPAREPLTFGDSGDYGPTVYWWASARWQANEAGTQWTVPFRFTWTSSRYRFVYTGPTVIPPLRQFHRDDGLAGGARSQVNPTSRQASQRQGINGTYL